MPSAIKKIRAMTLSTLTAETRQKFAIENIVTFGVVVTYIAPWAFKKGQLQVGDVIMEVDGVEVEDPVDAVNKMTGSFTLRVSNGQGETRYVPLQGIDLIQPG
jgi:C-terminal processing protease CtpA/Prc